MAEAVDGDVILWRLRHHAVKQRHKQLLHSTIAPSVQLGKSSARHTDLVDTEPTIMTQLARHGTLQGELQNRYGGQMQSLVTEAFSQKENGVQLIEQLLADRKRQHTQIMEGHQENIRRLNIQREVLISERKEVQEQAVALQSQGETASDVSIHGVDSFIRSTRDGLPQQEEKIDRLRSQYLEEYKDRLRTVYKGELGPQSYQLWQMPDYYMVRSLVDEIVNKMLDTYFCIPLGADRDIQRALLAENAREWKQWKYSMMESRIVQLIMEELILLETGQMARQVAEEFLAVWEFVKFKSYNNMMDLIEGIAVGSDEGRGPEDPAHAMNIGNYQKLQQGRAKYRSDQWVHTQHIHLPDTTEEVRVEEDKDVTMLYMHNIVPTYLWEEEGRIHDAPEEKLQKERLGTYRNRECLHWQAMDVTLTTLTVTKKANGVSIIRFSPNHSMVAMGTAHGDLLVYDLSWSPWRVIRVIHNSGRGHDPVLDITWSLDGTMLATTNQMGTWNLWSMEGSGVVKSDLKGLDVKADDKGILPEQLTHLLTLDVDARDFTFQAGPLSNFGTQNEGVLYAPILSIFHPSLTLFGTQFAVCVVLENGDIIRSDVEQLLNSKVTAVSQTRPVTDQSGSPQGLNLPSGAPSRADTQEGHDALQSQEQEERGEDQPLNREGSEPQEGQEQGRSQQSNRREGESGQTTGPEDSAVEDPSRALATEQSDQQNDQNWDELETRPSPVISEPKPISTTRIVYPQVRHQEPNILGQDIEGDLLREHTYPVVLLSCINQIGDLVSVDVRGYINIWKYSFEDVSDFGWFQPCSKYQLDFSTIFYSPAPGTKPEVIFTDNRKLAANKLKTAQEIAKERDIVEKQISQLGSIELWHADFNETTKQMTEIFKPSGSVADSGGPFHLIVRHDVTDQLSMYITQIYKPVRVKSTKFLCCVMNATATCLIFVLLFPEHPPKEAHISVVVVELETMSVRDYRNDIRISEERYHQCLHDNVVACDITRTIGTTGSEYLFLNISGRIFAVSLNTGAFVVRTEDPRHPGPDTVGCRLNSKLLNIPPSSEVVVGSFLNQVHVLLYTSGQKQKKNQNSITVLTIVDASPEDERRLTHAAYKTWADESDLPPPEQRQDVMTLDLDHQHPWAFCRTLVLEVMDAGLQSKNGQFTAEEKQEFAEIDRTEIYNSLSLEVFDEDSETGDEG